MQSKLKTSYIESSITFKRYWDELREFRELIYLLSWRDILIRYKQTAIGILWTVLKPLLLLGALVIVFGRIAKLSTQESTPYPLFVLAALLPWQFFANSMAEGVESIIKNQTLVTKIYFPRMVIPISAGLVSLLDLSICSGLVALAMLYYQFLPSIHVLFLPIFVVMMMLFTFGCNLWISSLAVRYRDVRYLVPFAIQFGLYMTPVGFGSAHVPEHWRVWYSFNPLVGIIDGFRWSMLDGQAFYWPSFILAFVGSLIIFFSGLIHFKKAENNFADII